MGEDLLGLIFATIVFTVAYAIYHSIGLYIIKHIKPLKLSKTLAYIYAVLFPGVSHQYPLSYYRLHGLRVNVMPASLSVPLYLAFVLMFQLGLGDVTLRRFALVALLVIPYALSIWRTVKLTNTLVYVQSLDALLGKKKEQADRISVLKKQAWEQIMEAEKSILHENDNLKRQIKAAEIADKRLEREVERENRKKRNLEVLEDCNQKGFELGIDSNILMECDDDFFNSLKENRLVISKFVHQEWDKLKNSAEQNVQHKARKAMYRFEELQKDGNIRTIIKQWNHSFLKAHALMDKPGDESIIADYLYENEENSGNIRAISFDTGFRTSARGAGLAVLDIQK